MGEPTPQDAPSSGGGDAGGGDEASTPAADEPQTEVLAIDDWGPDDPCKPMPSACKGASDPVYSVKCTLVTGKARFRGEGDGACGGVNAVSAVRLALCDAKVKPTADDWKDAECVATVDPCRASERPTCPGGATNLRCSAEIGGASFEETGSSCGHGPAASHTAIMQQLCEQKIFPTPDEFHGIACKPVSLNSEP